MKNSSVIISFGMTLFLTFFLTSCATTELAFEDICQEEEVSFVTIENATNDASMDLYIDGFYLATVAPGGQYFLDNVMPGKHEIEGRESNGFRLWIKDVTIEKSCDDVYIGLGE